MDTIYSMRCKTSCCCHHVGVLCFITLHLKNLQQTLLFWQWSQKFRIAIAIFENFFFFFFPTNSISIFHWNSIFFVSATKYVNLFLSFSSAFFLAVAKFISHNLCFVPRNCEKISELKLKSQLLVLKLCGRNSFHKYSIKHACLFEKLNINFNKWIFRTKCNKNRL